MLPKQKTPTLVENLSRIISARRLSYRGLSLKAGLNETAVRDIMHTRSRSPRYCTILALCEALNVQPDVLMKPFKKNVPLKSSTAGLTVRQSEILELMAAGKSDIEIGMLLNISKHTVNQYLREIYRKVGANTRTLVAVKAIELGILTISNLERISSLHETR